MAKAVARAQVKLQGAGSSGAVLPANPTSIPGMMELLETKLDLPMIEQPEGLSVTLRDYQKQSVYWMLEQEKLANDEDGGFRKFLGHKIENADNLCRPEAQAAAAAAAAAASACAGAGAGAGAGARAPFDPKTRYKRLCTPRMVLRLPRTR